HGEVVLDEEILETRPCLIPPLPPQRRDVVGIDRGVPGAVDEQRALGRQGGRRGGPRGRRRRGWGGACGRGRTQRKGRGGRGRRTVQRPPGESPAAEKSAAD